MNQQERYKQAKKITFIGAIINASLGIIKLAGGALFHSHALIADGVHSFSDLITDIMVLFASKYSNQDADHSHPYGHQRIETAATFMLALLLILAGIGISWDALNEIMYATHTKPDWLALPIALLSVGANEILFYSTRAVGKRIESALIIANAWHHRSDAAASLVVALGLLGSLLGQLYLDAVAAIIVSGMIIKMGLSYGSNSIKELVDTAVDKATLDEIEKTIQNVDGVNKIHQLRSRSMGGCILIDVHILVSPFISVSEGHYIAQHVHQALISAIKAVKDVTVHVDPEDDETCCPSLHLPNRKILEQELLENWQQAFPAIQNWTLHYLDGNIIIDLKCQSTFDQWHTLLARIHKDLEKFNVITKVRLLTEQGVIHCGKT